jgi:pyruvate-formate lyase
VITDKILTTTTVLTTKITTKLKTVNYATTKNNYENILMVLVISIICSLKDKI